MKLKYLSWLPAVMIMVMIFCFSARPADASNASSLTITDKLIQIYEKVSNSQLTTEEKLKLEGTINHIVRKTAHFCEYALLAAMVAFHLAVWRRKGKQLFYLPVIVSFLYASTDEYHQTFVPGRSGMVRDVLLDTTGAAFGTLIFILVLAFITKRIAAKVRL